MSPTRTHRLLFFLRLRRQHHAETYVQYMPPQAHSDRHHRVRTLALKGARPPSSSNPTHAPKLTPNQTKPSTSSSSRLRLNQPKKLPPRLFRRPRLPDLVLDLFLGKRRSAGGVPHDGAHAEDGAEDASTLHNKVKSISISHTLQKRHKEDVECGVARASSRRKEEESKKKPTQTSPKSPSHATHYSVHKAH